MRNRVEPLQEGLQALRKRDVLTARRRLGNLHSVQNRDRKRTQKRLFPISTCRRRRHAQAHALVRLRARAPARTTYNRTPRCACVQHHTNLARSVATPTVDEATDRFRFVAVHCRRRRARSAHQVGRVGQSCPQVAIAAAFRWLHGPHRCSYACAPECCSPVLLTIDGWYISRSQRECSNITAAL